MSDLENQEAVRQAARAYAQPFRTAVAQAQEEAQVDDPDRRGLLRGFIKPDGDDSPTR